MMILQLFIIFGCLAVGELVIMLTGLRFPSSIIGMLLLTLLLQLKIVKLDWVSKASNFLVDNLGFFFIPPGVALMCYFDIIKAQWFPIVVATVVSTIIVLLTTGHIHQMTRSHHHTQGDTHKHRDND